MTTLIKRFALATSLILGSCTLTFAQNETPIATEIADFSHIAGTFHFESPTDKMFFWSTAYIESLYADIEKYRLEYEHYRWEFTNDMTIVIYSREYIESNEFIPNNSPYNQVGKL